jgi:rhodanese-related sulfurtransferase
MNLSKALKEFSVFFSLSFVIALAANAFLPGGIPLVGQWDLEKGVITADAGNDAINNDIEIDDVDVAKRIFDLGKAVFVDARPAEAFSEGHIQGAVSMPVDQFYDHIESFMSMYPENTYIVTYCSGRACTDSHELAKLFVEIGYNTISVFIDGFDGWQKNGLPIDEEQPV